MPYMDTIEGFEARVFSTLNLVYGDNLRALQGIVSHAASQGGITDEHALILRIHGGDREYIDSIKDPYDPSEFDQYLVDPASRGITIERRQTSLSRAGPTQLIVVRDGPASSQTMDVFERSVRLVEDMMGETYPTNSVILIVEGQYTSAALPIIRFAEESLRNEHIADGTRSTVVHELAHHFWGKGTTWITEGAATFMELRSGIRNARMICGCAAIKIDLRMFRTD